MALWTVPCSNLMCCLSSVPLLFKTRLLMGGGGSRVLQSGRAAVWQKLTLPSGGHTKPEGTELFALKPPPPQMRLGMSL